MTRRQAFLLATAFTGLLMASVLASAGVAQALDLWRLGPRAALLVGHAAFILLPACLFLPLLPRGSAVATGLTARGLVLMAVAVPVGWLAMGSAMLATTAALEGAGWSGLAAARARVLETHGELLRVDGAAALATSLAVVVIGAAIEELAFRGVLQRLLDRAVGIVVAIAFTSLLFSALHFEPLGFAPRALVGLACGLALHRSGSLLPPILIHGGLNALTVVACAVLGPTAALGLEPVAAQQVAPHAILALVATAAFLALIALAPVDRRPAPARDA